MTKNESYLDREIRVVVALALFAIAYFKTSGVVSIVLYVLGAIALITAITGFCGLYKLLGIGTKKK